MFCARDPRQSRGRDNLGLDDEFPLGFSGGDDVGFMPAIIVVGELEEDQARYRDGVLAGFEVGVGAQIISGTPEIGFELFELLFGHAKKDDAAPVVVPYGGISRWIWHKP